MKNGVLGLYHGGIMKFEATRLLIVERKIPGFNLYLPLFLVSLFFFVLFPGDIFKLICSSCKSVSLCFSRWSANDS